jgi:hypothetical protein
MFSKQHALLITLLATCMIALSACTSLFDREPTFDRNNQATPESFYKRADGSIDKNHVTSIRSADDKHVYVQVRTYDDNFSLFRSTYDLRSSKRVVDGGAFFELSPSRRYLLFESSYYFDKKDAEDSLGEVLRLSIIDTKKNDKKILDKVVDKKEGNFIKTFGWCANDDAIWYTVGEYTDKEFTDCEYKTYRYNIVTGRTEKLFEGQGLSCSNDGRYFLYTSYGEKKSTICLSAYDSKSRRSDLVAEEDMVDIEAQLDSTTTTSSDAPNMVGDIRDAIFSINGRFVYYGILSEFKDNSNDHNVSVAIRSVEISSKKTRVLWERSVTTRESPFTYGTVELGRLINGANDNEILFHFQYDTYDESDDVGGRPVNISTDLLKANTVNRKQEKLLTVFEGNWDFVPSTNTLLWLDGETVKEKRID